MQLVAIKLINQEQPNGDIIVGGRVTDDGQNIILAIQNGVQKVVKIMPYVEDFVDHIVTQGTPLYYKLVAFFDDIFNILPEKIDMDGEVYTLTMQKSRGKGIDKIFYMIEPNKEDVKFFHEAQYMGEAKRELRKELKALNVL